MKFREVTVPTYLHRDEFGEVHLKDVKVLVDFESTITAESFNQTEDDFFLDSDEIDRISTESAGRFYDENAKALLREDRDLSAAEVNGIKTFLGVNSSELGLLIGLNKGGVSKILSEKQKIPKDKTMLILGRLNEELTQKGVTKNLLQKLKTNNIPDHVTSKGVPSIYLAEAFIRRFETDEDPITPMKLQKLLYYSQGIAMARCGIKIFNEPIMAWKHGPVIKEVWERHNTLKLLTKDPTLDISLIENDNEIKSVIDETVAIYGVYSAGHLRDKTHREKPWCETPLNHLITDQLMMDFFARLIV